MIGDSGRTSCVIVLYLHLPYIAEGSLVRFRGVVTLTLYVGSHRALSVGGYRTLSVRSELHEGIKIFLIDFRNFHCRT